MAEAAVEERPPQTFYCHMCNVQFQDASTNYTCPHCSDGFIEVLQDDPEDGVDFSDLEWPDDDMEDMRNLPGLNDRRQTRSQDANRPGRRSLTRIASSNLRQNVPFDLLQDFIVSLGVGVNWGTAGNMLFLGNPGDYAWGREGLDAIVTQLLNQMDGTGPPPVPKEIIDSLKSVPVTDDQVNAKLQCSVCLEDFQSNEIVRQLPCQHIYHEKCIRPWLELHGTCPICRQNLTENEQPENDGNQDGGAAGRGLLPFMRDLLQSAQASTPTGSSSSNTADSSSRSRSFSDSMM